MVAPTDPQDPFDIDRARARLEDVILTLPIDRALPDLDELLAAASVPRQLLQQDERLRKVLHEAVLARPFAAIDEVRATRTEVELLILEVEVLTDRLRDDLPAEERARVRTRLTAVSARLRSLQAHL